MKFYSQQKLNQGKNRLPVFKSEVYSFHIHVHVYLLKKYDKICYKFQSVLHMLKYTLL